MTQADTKETPKQRAMVEGWRTDLAALHARIASRFRRAEVRARAQRYLAGLLARVDCKNGWQLAEQLGEAGPQGVQRLLNTAHWDADAVRDDLRTYVVEQLGTPDGVLVVDETGFLKKGTKSVGVKRQYCGTAGRVENCQVGVFLAYTSTHGRAFLDRELYLPEEWVADQERRAAAGVPTAVGFATKGQLARTMLGRAFAAGVPAAWVRGDAVYGDDSRLRRWLEEQGRAYVLATSSGRRVVVQGRHHRIEVFIASLPAAAWQRLSAGEGSQGPRLYDWARVLLDGAGPDGLTHWALARRSLRDPREVAYYRAAGPAKTSLAALVRVAGARWAIEEGFERAKDLVGLDQYEVRRWQPWYRHITLALLAHAYLEVTRAQATTVAADGGKRGTEIGRAT